MTKSKIDDKKSPYPGLRFYEADQADFFAGREEAAKNCARLLGASRVVILHGRSGCGKSSFLRAGVKPLLENADRRSAFPENFDVVRSTEDPMREFGNMLLNVADRLIEGDPNAYWKLAEGVTEADLDGLKKMIGGTSKRQDICELARKSHQLLIKLSELLEASPVFVVDQGEEVFTIYEKRERRLAKLSDDHPEKETEKKALVKLKDKASEFFELLGRVAEKGPSSIHIVVSLRTEYKGLLDDRVSAVNYDVSQIRGFHLEELDPDGLIAAIRRPTLDQEEWAELQRDGAVSGGAAPYKELQFKFPLQVAKVLAKDLADSDQVPEGGVLPTLQIACLRLWEQAKDAATGKRFEIKKGQLKRIGKIDSQIQEFLSQRLEEACRDAKAWEVGEAEAVERWHLILFRALVDVQADGRAVTSKLKRDALANQALDIFKEDRAKDEGRALKRIHKVIDYLREERVALLNYNENDDTLALGHDSVALSLNKWNVKYSRDDRMTTRMMMMSDIAPSSDYKMADLFPKRGKSRPHQIDIVLHRDDHWDRQFAQFASVNKFAERLGFNFITDSEGLDLTRKSGRGRLKDWDELAKKLRQAEGDSQKKRTRKEDPINERILVAADWSSFPLPSTEASGQKEDSEEFKERKKQQLQKWSDIMVTDLFTGNALIGPETDLKHSLQMARETQVGADPGLEYKEVIKEAFQKLRECKGFVYCHDDLARRFVQGAAKLSCGVRSEEFKYVNDPENIQIFESDDIQSSYPLSDWFLDGTDDGNDRPRYIVGTAATRAIALQGGGQLFFGTSELTRLARTKINQIRRGDEEKLDEGDLHQLIQDIIKHTSWQLGIAPSQWNQGRNRAMVLRLASVGYYTADHIRSNADDFVRFIRDQVNERLSGDDGKGASRGTRMNRDSIRNAVRECYSIKKFDEYGVDFYDLDSTTAYATEHPEFDSKSVASEIYNELASLRQRTIVHYENVSRMIIWLRDRKGYGLEKDYTKKVSELKDCAWRNYRIFNFYDSARFMAEAALILQQEIEVHGEK